MRTRCQHKADDANLAGASGLSGQPGAHRRHIVERPAFPGAQVVVQGTQVLIVSPLGTEWVPPSGSPRWPVGLLAKVVAHAQGVIDDTTPGRGPGLAARPGR
jgi:hypothetical protein